MRETSVQTLRIASGAVSARLGGWPGYPKREPAAGLASSRRSESCEARSAKRDYMKLYELDAPDTDDFVTKLSYPDKTATLTGCDEDGCSESTSSWSRSSTNRPRTGVRAEMRISVSARHRNFCRW